MNVFDAMGIYWSEIADKDQTEQQLQFLKKNLSPGAYVLDLACGTARHSIPLSEAGYLMIGLDLSTNLLRIAKQRSSHVQLVRGDIRFLPFKPEVFDAAINMDTSFGYLHSEKEDMRSLMEAQLVLKRDGKLIVDVFNGSNLIAKYGAKNPMPKWREYPSFFLLQNRKVSEDGNWLCDSWTTRDKASEQIRVFDHTVRLYEATQLKGLMEMAGFRVKQVLGSYEGQEFSLDSARLIILGYAK